MNKTEAILELMRDARSERSSRTSYKRVCRALDVLDREGNVEIKTILQWLEYVSYETGQPYPRYTERPK